MNQNEIGVYINENVPNLSCLVYADDVADGADTVLRLQKQIDTISRFCDCTGLKLNISKTKIVVFRRGGIVKENEKWFYKGKKIDVVSYYKYLGLIFTSKLNWKLAA